MQITDIFELRLPVFPYANTVGTKKFSKCFKIIILSTATLHWSLWELFFPFKSPTSPSVWIWNVWPKRFPSWRAAFLRLPLEIKTYLEKIDKMLFFAIKSSNYRNWENSILVFHCKNNCILSVKNSIRTIPGCICSQ